MDAITDMKVYQDDDEAAWFTRELQETLVRVFREAGCVGEGNVVE